MKKTLFSLYFLLILPVLSFGQTFSSNYQDGKIWFKMTNETRFSLELNSNPDKLPLNTIPGLDAVAKKYGATNLSKPFHIAKESKELQLTFMVEFTDYSNIDQFIRELSSLKNVEYAEKVPLYKHFLTTNDPYYSSQWGLTKINAQGAWNYFSTGSTVVVAIVDDAVKRDHPDLAPNLWVNPGEIPGNGIDDDGNGYIDDVNGYDVGSGDNNPNPPSTQYGHGTHVAGIVSAASNNGIGVSSIGYSCKLMCVKATDSPTVVSHGYQGITYAAANGANVINASWGGPGGGTTGQNVINYAISKGAIVVAASGNDNVQTQFYPAAYSGVVSVAATNSSDKKASFSNYGSWIKISAPGDNILSTTVDNSYGYKSGTSMASPMVAGLVGLMKSLNPTLPNADIINCLYSTAQNINSLNPSYSGLLGAGRIDANAAMACVAASLSLPPVADFTANFTTINAGASVLFTDQSTYNPTTWNWTFTGGMPSSFNGKIPPAIVYSTPGTYTVTLTVTNGNGSDAETKTNYITVNPPSTCDQLNYPIPSGWTFANYTAGAGNGYVNGSNIYGDKEKAMYFDASATSNTMLNAVYVAFAKANSSNLNKIVPIKIYDGTTGTPGTILGTTNLTIGEIKNDVLNGSYTEVSFVNNVVTLPASKKFFVSVDVSNLTWSGDSLSILSNTNGQTTPSDIWEKQSDNVWYQYGTAGSFALNSSLIMHPFLTTTPTQAVLSASSLSVCEGESIDFNAAGSTYEDTLLWYFPGGTPQIVPSAPTATVAFNSPGTYEAILYVVGGGCSLFDSTFVTITVKPNPTVTIAGNASICKGSSTSLTASGANTYIWNNGLGIGSNKTVTPDTTTTYIVTGTAANGCENIAQYEVVVNPLPTISLGGDITICSGNSATLTPTGGTSYSWNQGLGTGNSKTVNPTSDTEYIVTGTDANGCQNKDTIMVFVNTSLNVSAGSNVTICSGQSTTLTASGASNYTWDQGLGNGASHSVSPTTTTTYQVTGTSGGCSSSAQVTVTVNTPPTVSAGSNVTICSGGNTTLTGTGASSYTWDNGLGAGASHTVNPTSTTTYQVTGTANGCNATAQVTVTVDPIPVVSAGSNVAICVGQSTTLTAIGASTYTWNNGLGSGASHSVSPTTTTMYQVTGYNGTCSATSQVTVTVNPLPIVSAGSDVTICAGQSTTIAGTGATTYTWNNGLGAGASHLVSPTTSTSYTVTGNDGNCSNTASVMVNVTPLPTVTVSPNVAICNGQNATISASGASSYSWDNGFNGAAQTVFPTATTTYVVTGTNGACSNTAQVVVTVNNIPTAVINMADSTVGCPTSVTFSSASSTGASTYAWTFPGGTPNTSTNANPTATFGTAGSVTVLLTTTNDCGSANSSFPITIDIYCAGLEDLTNDFIVTVNETQSEIHIFATNGLEENSVIQLYNELGQLVSSKQVDGYQQLVVVPIEDLASGVYLIRLKGSSSDSLHKVVKQK
ncbi:MAG: S8 family serine peptidase [Crocinitomicaceae bacterium]|nr:S8 family serine peptidase [Crocinitomicaceae bacterium]